MKELHEQVATIQTRTDLVGFIEALNADLAARPEDWENPTLASFLGAMASWIEDMDGFYENDGRALPPQPNWKMIGEMLAAARIYE